jgi:hypothetical protein
MLNPRSYFEDTIRRGLNGLWAAGMPWKLVNEAIDSRFEYNTRDECRSAWSILTSRNWNNTDDSPTKRMICPSCARTLEIPWTTCGLPEDKKEPGPGVAGEGYGDDKLAYTCPGCHLVVTRGLLELGKFVQDVKSLVSDHRPMPGTILDEQLPPQFSRGPSKPIPRTFPNRLLSRLHKRVVTIFESRDPQGTSLESIRELIESNLNDSNQMRQVDDFNLWHVDYLVPRVSRLHIRKMMSRYWNNAAPFAVELSGAVLRQSIFTEKMCEVIYYQP